MFGYWGFLNIAEGNWLGELANIARETIERRLLKFSSKSATGLRWPFMKIIGLKTGVEDWSL